MTLADPCPSPPKVIKIKFFVLKPSLIQIVLTINLACDWSKKSYFCISDCQACANLHLCRTLGYIFTRDGELKLQLSFFMLKKQGYLPVLIQKLMSVKNVRLMLTYSLLLAHKNFQLSIVT